MKHLALIVSLCLALIPLPVNAQGGQDCNPAEVQEWIRQRQEYRAATQAVLDATGVTTNSALLQLSDHLRQLEDLPRPGCADDAMLWTYYLYTNLEHLLICAQNGDTACSAEVQGRLTDYRQRDEQIMNALADGSGISRTVLQPPTPTPAPQTKRLGPIWDSLQDETYNIEVGLGGTRFLQQSGFQEAKPDHTFVVVDISITNLGPGSLNSIGSFDFQVRDANNALRDYTYLTETDNCRLELVDLMPGGSISGCVAFEVPASGNLELIYAPYRYEGLVEGRYLSFKLR